MVYLDQLIRNVAVHKCHHAKIKYLCSSCFIRSIHVCMDRMRWRNVLLLVAGYSCAYQSDILIQGSLYISPNWFCFHSKILGIKTEVCRPIHPSTHAPWRDDLECSLFRCSCKFLSTQFSTYRARRRPFLFRTPSESSQQATKWVQYLTPFIDQNNPETRSSCAWNLSAKVKNCVQSRCALIIEPVV